jgi:sugar lactone lactonase YvrE
MVVERVTSRSHRRAMSSGTPRLLAILSFVAGPLVGQTQVPPDTVTTFQVDQPLVGLGNIGGVTVDALGFVYVANFHDAVWQVGPNGSTRRLTNALYGASGNAVDGRGDLYQSNFYGNAVMRIRRTGEIETFVAEGLRGPVGLTFDDDGNLYVCNCNAGSISRVTPDGVVSEFARSPLMACPNGITRDDRGDFYVVSFNSPDLVRITPDGTVHPFTQVTGAGGNGHITFARGGFFLTQFRGHAVYRVSRTGEVTKIAGDGVREVRDGTTDQARFSFPNGIAVGSGGNVLWVNDLVGPYNEGAPTQMVLRRIRLVTLTDMLTGALAEVDPARGPGIVREVYAAYATAKPWDDTRGDAVSHGYRLLSTGQAATALALFLLNAERYASDAAAAYHLGEAYRFTGQPAQAATQYRQALELDPHHAQASQRLSLVEGAGK